MNFTDFYFQEKFAKGFQGKWGYVELFVNPTQREVQNGSDCFRGLIDSKGDLYIWGYNEAGHDDVMEELKSDFKDIPIYVYPKTNKVEVSLWSILTKSDIKKKEAKSLVQSNKNLQRFLKTNNILITGI